MVWLIVKVVFISMTVVVEKDDEKRETSSKIQILSAVTHEL